MLPCVRWPPWRQVHRQHLVARLQEGEIDRHVRAAAGVRLHIGVLGAEQLLGPVNGQLLDHVHVFAAAVPALLRIAFGVFVGQHRALRLHHGRAGEVLAGDQFDVLLLALALVLDARRRSPGRHRLQT